jgi:hypothetical protein
MFQTNRITCKSVLNFAVFSALILTVSCKSTKKSELTDTKPSAASIKVDVSRLPKVGVGKSKALLVIEDNEAILVIAGKPKRTIFGEQFRNQGAIEKFQDAIVDQFAKSSTKFKVALFVNTSHYKNILEKQAPHALETKIDKKTDSYAAQYQDNGLTADLINSNLPVIHDLAGDLDRELGTPDQPEGTMRIFILHKKTDSMGKNLRILTPVPFDQTNLEDPESKATEVLDELLKAQKPEQTQ